MSRRTTHEEKRWLRWDRKTSALINKTRSQIATLRQYALVCNDIPTATLLKVAEEQLDACKDGITRYKNPNGLTND